GINTHINEIKSLNYKPTISGNVELIDYGTTEGKRVYVRGIMYIMAMAINELYPDSHLTINYQLDNSMFCTFEKLEITDEFINNVKRKMREIIDADLPIKKVKMTQKEAEEFYEKEKNLRGILQIDSETKEEVSLYYCKDYYNYFYGVMPISTGYMKVFDIQKYANGFLLRYPSKKKPGELKEFKENKKLLSTLQDYEDIYRILKLNTIYRLNKKVEEDNGKETILLSEALHEKKISDIADAIAKNKKVKMILIAGPSSSGKTTFAKRLGIQLKLNGIEPKTLSVDNYFVEREQNPVDENGELDFECIEAVDLRLFNEHILRLLAGEEVELPTFDFSTGHKKYLGNKMKLKENEILVIEGIHCLNDKLTESISRDQKFKIYISALTVLNIDYYNRISTTDTRLIRRIVRDYKYRTYSARDTIQRWHSVNRGEKKYIYPFQEEANAMFNTSIVYELGVLKDYALPLLKEITNEAPEYAEAKRLITLLNYFKSIPTDYIPESSILREFIGGSVFDY
ncbi:MAG: nucleoside kinase, partial [Clostridia bacterium]|nr:nucleoside kinase [Clostridia bacterium]